MEQTKNIDEILSVLKNRGYQYSKKLRTTTLDDLKVKYSRHLQSSISETINGYTYFIVWYGERYRGRHTENNGIESYILHNDIVVSHKSYNFFPVKQLKVEARRYINLLIRTNTVEELERHEENKRQKIAALERQLDRN